MGLRLIGATTETPAAPSENVAVEPRFGSPSSAGARPEPALTVGVPALPEFVTQHGTGYRAAAPSARLPFRLVALDPAGLPAQDRPRLRWSGTMAALAILLVGAGASLLVLLRSRAVRGNDAAAGGVPSTRAGGRRPNHKELELANRELEQANRLKSEFHASMSHELRTPLTAIIGCAELLKEETYGSLNAKQRRYAQDIYEAARHLLSLIGDMLAFSRLEVGGVELRQAQISPAELCKSVIRVLEPRAARDAVCLCVDVSRDLPPVTVDSLRLRQVLYNLLISGVKFTPAGGCVSHSVRRDGDSLLVAVRDTGIGIAPEDVDNLFQPFRQLRRSAAPSDDGAGLAL